MILVNMQTNRVNLRDKVILVNMHKLTNRVNLRDKVILVNTQKLTNMVNLLNVQKTGIRASHVKLPDFEKEKPVEFSFFQAWVYLL